MMKTEIGIRPTNAMQVAQSLNTLLADEHVLYIKTRRAHWNVEDSNFLTIHRFFEEQYKQLEELIDDIAERIRTIGHYAEGALGSYLQNTHLSEQIRENNDGAGFVAALLKDHESIIIHLRESAERYNDEWRDAGTSDFITGILEKHEKMAWMLRSHLK